jgi:translation initiation factor IF-2
VIYDLIDDVKAAMEGKLRAVEERVPLGTAEVKALFGSGACVNVCVRWVVVSDNRGPA